MNWGTTGYILLGLTIFGAAMSAAISYMKCSKIDDVLGMVGTGAWWALFPTLTYVLLNYSTYLKSEFESGITWIVSKFGAVSDKATAEENGIIYAMGLVALIMTSSMINQLDVKVCKPTIDELATFQEDMMKKLKEKEAANKTTS
jgi:hypothetical protein